MAQGCSMAQGCRSDSATSSHRLREGRVHTQASATTAPRQIPDSRGPRARTGACARSAPLLGCGVGVRVDRSGLSGRGSGGRGGARRADAGGQAGRVLHARHDACHALADGRLQAAQVAPAHGPVQVQPHLRARGHAALIRPRYALTLYLAQTDFLPKSSVTARSGRRARAGRRAPRVRT